MDKEQIRKYLQDNGWTTDEYGHMRRGGKILRPVRVKFQLRNVRIEVKIRNVWVRMGGDFYSRIQVMPANAGVNAGKLRIGGHVFGNGDWL